MTNIAIFQLKNNGTAAAERLTPKGTGFGDVFGGDTVKSKINVLP
jgi:hypothetical protein